MSARSVIVVGEGFISSITDFMNVVLLKQFFFKGWGVQLLLKLDRPKIQSWNTKNACVY